jgi:hypothetical protein
VRPVLAGEYVVYEPDGDQRLYWQGKGTRIWRPGDGGRASAARFPDMQQARAAIAGSRRWRRRLPVLGYEYLPIKIVQPVLLSVED